MSRLAVAASILLIAATATAQPSDPYADPAPADPYATPAPKPAPKPTKPPVSKPAPKLTKPVVHEPADPYSAVPGRVGISDVAAVQGLLAVQRLDGWLLFDRGGENPIARDLVAPTGHPTRLWFYLIPAKGQPVALVAEAEKHGFAHLAGKQLAYRGYRDLGKQLRVLLRGMRRVAVEYSPRAALPNVSRIDAGTLELVRAAGVQVRSSDTLIQYTKAMWGDLGRTLHYTAMHHLVELRRETLVYVARQLAAGRPVTEYEVQQQLAHGMTMRGIVGPPPVVAAGVDTANPDYVPTASRTRTIRRGDLILVGLAGKLDKPDAVYAAHTWVAIADSTVPADIERAFAIVGKARDRAIDLIAARSRDGRPVTGVEVDRAARKVLQTDSDGTVLHRTGHSIDSELEGSGTNLDDLEVKDTRIVMPGTGFTVGPGLYVAGRFGVRSEVCVYLSPGGPEITSPVQDAIEPLFSK